MNNHSLDQLQQFAAFIEFLAKPEDHKKLLAELQKTTLEHTQAVNALREAKDFNSWVAYHKSRLESQEKSLEVRKEQVEKDAQDAKDFSAAESVKLEARQVAVANKEVDVEKRLAELEYVKTARAELTQGQVALSNAKALHAKQVEEFDKKAAALAALMGNK